MREADRLIINAAITGIVPAKEDSPYVAVGTEETVEWVQRVRDVGASIVHVHARDSLGQPTSNGSFCVEMVERIQEVCPEVIIGVSCSGRKVSNVEKRAACLQGKAEMASLSLGSQNFPHQAVRNPS